MVTDGGKAAQTQGYGARRPECVTGATGRFTGHYGSLAARQARDGRRGRRTVGKAGAARRQWQRTGTGTGSAAGRHDGSVAAGWLVRRTPPFALRCRR
ncbi:hypothetical protein FCJ57_11020 [Burkholderia diffusa]|nr:hypothetical protein [Burkholderia diffusa]